MTQIFKADGTVVPVTRIQVSPLTVTQVKQTNGQASTIQVGFGVAKTVAKPQQGHLKGLPLFSVLREFPVNQEVKRGDQISVETLKEGDLVSACGVSKGKGFAGVVKRHHFRGGPASHGHKDNSRMPGSIGAGGVQRVFKDMRMAGHMGNERVTIKNLEIVAVDTEKNELLIKGAVPGARNGLVILQGTGELVINVSKDVATSEADASPATASDAAHPADVAESAPSSEETAVSEPSDSSVTENV